MKSSIRQLALLAASVLTFALASPAMAGDLWMEEVFDGTRMVGVVMFRAAPGEANAVTVAPSPGTGGSVLAISDAGAPVSAHWGLFGSFGCENFGGPVCSYPGVIALVDLDLGDGADRATVTAPVRATVLGGDGNDRLNGGPGRDLLAGGSDIDTLAGGGDCDRLFGGTASDWLDGGPGADLFDGGPGKDYADYSQRTQSIRVSLDGPIGGGNSCIGGSTIGADDGDKNGEGDNVLTNVEAVWAGAGDDSLIGNGANNYLGGGAGWDILLGGAGADELGGDEGVDQLDGGPGADVLHGHDGTDSARYDDRSSNVRVSIDGQANDGDNGGAEGDNVRVDVENVLTGSGNDILSGSSGSNQLSGGAGNDSYFGGAGADQMFDWEGGADSFNAVDGDAGDHVFCGSQPDLVDDFSEYDVVFYDESPSGSRVDSLTGNCDEFFTSPIPDLPVLEEESPLPTYP
jgi:Ca2+-binding RTX toxin-like protein